MNFATAFLDGSAVYGSTPKSAEDLRLLESGMLNLDPGRVLAQDPRNVNCRRVTNDHAECLKSGDERVNHNAALASLHTLLAREHNRIASHLSAVNPHWDEETLYQGRTRLIGGCTNSAVYGSGRPCRARPAFLRISIY